jgi:hypothetical protein
MKTPRNLVYEGWAAPKVGLYSERVVSKNTHEALITTEETKGNPG